MNDAETIIREWVEIEEESEGSNIVLRPLDYQVPPKRGGRRHLDLRTGGHLDVKSQGPTDKLESSGGKWSITGQRLHLDAPGWEGDYIIEEQERDILILRKK